MTLIKSRRFGAPLRELQDHSIRAENQLIRNTQ